MKTQADCGPCLLKRVLFQARLAGNGTEFEAVKAAAAEYAAQSRPDICSAELGRLVHVKAYAAMGVKDPYAAMKVDSDRVAESFVNDAREYIDSQDDRLAAAVRVSVVGNIMDFGSGKAIDSPEEFSAMFHQLLEQGIGSDDTSHLEDLLDKGFDVLYAFDNCGEDCFDRLLIREIKALGKRVVGVVRGAPILNDVTREDAVRIGLDKELDGIVDTGGFTVGFSPAYMTDELKDEMGRASVLIAKGMANYESLSEMDLPCPVAYILRAKCLPVANSLNVPLGTNVVRVEMPVPKEE
ncbi:MAG: damage-control phosphatase ARMT1 family protein [Methanomethylophilus sp.]|jgi:uncharacterized protein with ATP-grasp and redox domains